MLTRTSHYALQALIYLVRQDSEQPLSARDIAESTDIPPKYLSTILTALVRANVLASARGKGGGFYLVRPAQKVSLFEIVGPFEPNFSGERQCPFGNDRCNDEYPCQAHVDWKQVLDHEQRFLKKKSLHDVSVRRDETFPGAMPKKGTSNETLTIS